MPAFIDMSSFLNGAEKLCLSQPLLLSFRLNFKTEIQHDTPNSTVNHRVHCWRTFGSELEGTEASTKDLGWYNKMWIPVLSWSTENADHFHAEQ